jgi:hypothetical protein
MKWDEAEPVIIDGIHRYFTGYESRWKQLSDHLAVLDEQWNTLQGMKAHVQKKARERAIAACRTTIRDVDSEMIKLTSGMRDTLKSNTGR